MQHETDLLELQWTSAGHCHRTVADMCGELHTVAKTFILTRLHFLANLWHVRVKLEHLPGPPPITSEFDRLSQSGERRGS
jgi:hypothetical protein